MGQPSSPPCECGATMSSVGGCCRAILLYVKAILPVDADMPLHERREEVQISVVNGLAISAQGAQTRLEMELVLPDLEVWISGAALIQGLELLGEQRGER